MRLSEAGEFLGAPTGYSAEPEGPLGSQT
jgi:hypothetical protein